MADDRIRLVRWKESEVAERAQRLEDAGFVDVVHDVALPAGMVDTKVCAIDGTWSGLRLTRRRS